MESGLLEYRLKITVRNENGCESRITEAIGCVMGSVQNWTQPLYVRIELADLRMKSLEKVMDQKK
jgi:hypothetical protein